MGCSFFRKADWVEEHFALSSPAFFGENLQINAPSDTDLNDRVDINATGQVSGTITTPDVSVIQNSLNALTETVINTETVIANSCVAHDEESGSRFLITGLGGLRDRPSSLSPASYPTGEVQAIEVQTTELQISDVQMTNIQTSEDDVNRAEQSQTSNLWATGWPHHRSRGDLSTPKW